MLDVGAERVDVVERGRIEVGAVCRDERLELVSVVGVRRGPLAERLARSRPSR